MAEDTAKDLGGVAHSVHASRTFTDADGNWLVRYEITFRKVIVYDERGPVPRQVMIFSAAELEANPRLVKRRLVAAFGASFGRRLHVLLSKDYAESLLSPIIEAIRKLP